jgi:hypothetical protein
VDRPKVEDSTQKNIDPNWVAGFTEGDGCFDVKLSSSKSRKTGYQILLRLTLTQHSRYLQLMSRIANNLGCGLVYE